MRPADLPVLLGLSQAVAWPHRAEDWADFLALGTGLVAQDAAGRLLGSAMRWDWGQACATIGMVLVAPEWQGRGIGRALMHRLLEEAGGRAVMLNATQAGLALYESLGFRPVGRVRQFQGVVDGTVPEPADAPDELATLAAADAQAFGAPRDRLIAQFGQKATFAVAGGGFAARRRFGRGQAIGPVVAPDEENAIALAAALLVPGFLRIDLPEEAGKLAGWALAAGLDCVDGVTVMLRGTWPVPAMQRFALASQAFG